MALLGQASGAFTESNSALRILHVGVRNSIGQLTADSFTQTNPPVTSDDGAGNSTVSTSKGFLTGVLGVLSGSVAFTRKDEGVSFHGGAKSAIVQTAGYKALGIFINTAVSNPFTNQPGIASNRGPYVSAQGSYGNQLYETFDLGDGTAEVSYAIGDELIASKNGYLTNLNNNDNKFEATATVLGILTIAPDTVSDELVYDQRI